MSKYNGLLDMKKIKSLKKAVIVFAIALINFFCYGQLEVVTSIPGGSPYSGGYQGGIYAGGGDDTYKDIPPPRNLSALGGDGEVLLEWESPLPLGEVRHDDNSAEFWYWLNSPSSNDDLFYVRFNAPVSGDITHISVLNAAVSSAIWDKIIICPDDGSGKPDLSSPWENFLSINVTTSPEKGGEWSILNLTTPQTVLYDETFYIVTKWPAGSTTGPFVGTDGGFDNGRSAYSLNNGATWITWPQNFIMRAYMVDDNNKSVSLTSVKSGNTGYVPVISISTGKMLEIKISKIAESIKVPTLMGSNSPDNKSPDLFKVYRANNMGGPYSFVDNATGLLYTDNTVTNNNEYFYVVTADYDDGESENSNEAPAYPQDAALVPYTNNFDIDNGAFYGRDDWQWGPPAYASGPISANSPPNVWGTVLDGPYSNLSSSWLILPFNLGSPVIYKLDFALWYGLESGFDFGYLAIDHNYDGIYEIIDSYTGSSGGWLNENMVIHDSLCTSYSRLAFILISNTSIVEAGFYVDNFSIDRYFDVDLTAFLEGPFNGVDMNTDLNTAGQIPLSQPYNTAPWNYSGTENVISIPNTNIIDWGLIELRDATDANSATSGTMFARQAAFFRNDASMVGTDGSSVLRFDASFSEQLFVVIWHRNHLGIMSAIPLIGNAGSYTFNFSSGPNQVYGGSAGHTEISTGVWGMAGGDGNHDNIVNSSDKSPLWENEAGERGYLNSDFNLDAESNNNDKDDVWLPNNSKGSQVPN